MLSGMDVSKNWVWRSVADGCWNAMKFPSPGAVKEGSTHFPLTSNPVIEVQDHSENNPLKSGELGISIDSGHMPLTIHYHDMTPRITVEIQMDPRGEENNMIVDLANDN